VLPLRCYPLLHWRMRAAERQVWNAPLDPDLAAPWSIVAGMRRLTVERPGLVDDVLAMVTERGPIRPARRAPTTCAASRPTCCFRPSSAPTRPGES